MLASLLLLFSLPAAAAWVECSAGDMVRIEGSLEGDVITASVKVFVQGQDYVNAGGIRYVRSSASTLFTLDKSSAQGVRFEDYYFVPSFIELKSLNRTLIWLPLLGDDGKPAPVLMRVSLTCAGL